MESTNLLIFRSYSFVNEPAISSPVGPLSIRNILVFGFFSAITAGLYRVLIADALEFPRDLVPFCIIVTPMIFGVMLAMIKPQIGTADSILLSVLYTAMNQNKHENKIKSNNKKGKESGTKKSKVLGFGKAIKNEKVADSDVVQEITCVDFDELKSMKIQLSYGNGDAISNTLVKCYIDDMLIDKIKTTFDGLVIIKVRPENAGKKKLVLRDEQDKIIYQKTLLFKKK